MNLLGSPPQLLHLSRSLNAANTEPSQLMHNRGDRKRAQSTT